MPDCSPPPKGFDDVLQHMQRLSSGCHGKQVFDSKPEVERAAARIRRTAGGQLNSYKCSDCRRWHFGNSGLGQKR